jgi:Uma2 family endonuclease
MTEQLIDSETRLDRENGVYGRVVARDVSAEDYMAQHAAHFREWVEGVVIDVSPVTLKHDEIVGYLRELLRSYFALNRIGLVVGAPVVMQLDSMHSRREPDLQVILKSNPAQKAMAAIIGPADICIEVVSPESLKRDYGDKFGEYQDAGVKEYWLIDPLRNTATFYRLNEDGIYMPQPLDTSNSYQTPLLPKLSIYVPIMWEEELPDIYMVTDSVRAMMKKPNA